MWAASSSVSRLLIAFCLLLESVQLSQDLKKDSEMKHVLAIPFVVKARETLESIKTHEQIILYLAILHQAALKPGAEALSIDHAYDDIRAWMTVPGSLASCYYLPLASRGKSFWKNANLAGSFARSSLRTENQRLFYHDDGSIRVPSASEISNTLLRKGERKIPCWAAAGFLFRNAAFGGLGNTPSPEDLVELFKNEFGLSSDIDYSAVFDFATPSLSEQVFEEIAEDVPVSAEISTPQIVNAEYRTLDCTDLEIEPQSTTEVAQLEALSPGSNTLLREGMDEIESEIAEALEAYSGVILSGSPGTSKSYYANKVAHLLTEGDYERMRFTQFHASYQFEDFIQGFAPDPESRGFVLKDGIFLSLCKAAHDDPRPHVIVIDELSRGDSCRIFGEALTYIERSKRGMVFYLPSGEQASVPENLYILATMNPLDRGADDVDIAFGRRFATIELEPSTSILRERLLRNGLDANLQYPLLAWFADVNNRCKDLSIPGIGHAYFWNVRDASTLEKAWRWQVRPHMEKSFGLHTTELAVQIKRFESIIQ